MADQEIASAFVDWANTFKLSRPVVSVSDLADSNILCDIAVNIDPKYFKFPGSSGEDNWVNNSNKLNRLTLLLKRYYEEILQYSVVNIESPDSRAIAKEANLVETMKLYSLIVTLAVNHPNKGEYIEKITSLSETSQKGLMLSIERVMHRLGESTVEAPPKISSSNLDDVSAEQRRLVAEKEALEKAHQALMERHTALTDQCDELQAEIFDLKQKLELALAQSTQTGKADFILKAEIDRLQKELKRYEKQVADNLKKLSEKDTEINTLTRKNETLSEQANEAARLKDEVQENKHAADELRRKENAIEKYKKKLEEAADLRQHMKNLEQENRNLIDRNQSIIEEYEKVAAFKSIMENYKKQVDELLNEKLSLISEKNKCEHEKNHLMQKIESYEMSQARDLENMQLLETRIRELEFGEGEPLKLDDDKVEVDDDQSINNSDLSDALKGDTMTSLRLKINELQREISRLREGRPSDDDANTQLLVLQHMVDEANRTKAKFETDYVKIQKEKLELESELKQLQTDMGSSSNGVNKNEYRKSYEKDKELVETKRKLREAQAKLEQINDTGEIRPDSNTEARIKALETEKEELRAQNEELSSMLKSLEDKSEDDIKRQNIQLHRKVDQLKMLITGQHEAIENYKHAMTSFEAEREAHAAEVKRLEQILKENKEQAQKEISLVQSAWFSMGRRIQSDHVLLQRQGPASFLNQQRLILDTQLKRR